MFRKYIELISHTINLNNKVAYLKKISSSFWVEKSIILIKISIFKKGGIEGGRKKVTGFSNKK